MHDHACDPLALDRPETERALQVCDRGAVCSPNVRLSGERG